MDESPERLNLKWWEGWNGSRLVILVAILALLAFMFWTTTRVE